MFIAMLASVMCRTSHISEPGPYRPAPPATRRLPASRALALLMFALVFPAAGTESTVDSLLELEREGRERSRATEAQAATLADDTGSMLLEYRAALEEQFSLEVYNQRLAGLIAEQERRLAGYDQRLAAVENTRRDIIPLLERMVQVLDRFVAADLPFLLSERQARVSALRAMLDDPAEPVAEQYRRVMEAWQVELEYGRKVETWRAEITIDGQARVVDLLRVGRVALIHLGIDGRSAGIWDEQGRRFVPVEDSYRDAIATAMQVARRELPPAMMRLPLPRTQP